MGVEEEDMCGVDEGLEICSLGNDVRTRNNP